MPRVLFVHHRPQPSGAARSLALLIGALGDEWEAHVMVPGGEAAELFRAAGATVHLAPVPAFTHTWDVQYHGLRWLVALRELASVPAHMRAFRRTLRELRPDVVHVNDSVVLYSAILAHRADVPVVWHLRSALAHGGTGRISAWIARTIDRTASAAIAIDDDVLASFPVQSRVQVISNPVVAVPGAPAVLAIPEGRLVVGFFGFIRRQKGWPELLEALRLLVDDGVAVQLVVVGGGVRPPGAYQGVRGRLLEALGVPNEEGAFETRSNALGLGDRITRVPFTNDTDAIYRALDMVVFPNQGVGLGRPVLEAGAYGLPVVASGSRGGGGVLVPGETGVLLERGTPWAIADALRMLSADPALRRRMGRAGAALADSASPDRVARRVESLWEPLVAQTGTPLR